MEIRFDDLIKNWNSFLEFIENETLLFELDFLGFPWYQNAIENINNFAVSRMPSETFSMSAELRLKDFNRKIRLLNEKFGHVFLIKAKQRRRDKGQIENYLFHDIFLHLKRKNERFLLLEMPQYSDTYDAKYLQSQFADITLPFEYLLKLGDSFVGRRILDQGIREYSHSIERMFGTDYKKSSHVDFVMALKQSYKRLASTIPCIFLMQKLLGQLDAKVFYGGMGTHFYSGLNNQWAVVEVEHGFGVNWPPRSQKVLEYNKNHFDLNRFYALVTHSGEITDVHHQICLKKNLFNYGMPELRYANISPESMHELLKKFRIENKNVFLFLTAGAMRLQDIKTLIYSLRERFENAVLLIRQHPIYDSKLEFEDQRNILFVNDENLYTLLSLADVVLSLPSSVITEAAAFTNKIIVLPRLDEEDELKTLRDWYPFAEIISLKEKTKIIQRIEQLLKVSSQKVITPKTDVNNELDRLFYAIEADKRVPSERDTDSLTKKGIDKFLNPQCTKENMDLYLVRSSILRALKEFLPQCKGIFLDVGCGEMPYKQLILQYAERYIGLDIENPVYQKAVKPDIFWDGKHIPLNDNSIDCAMATELFEHLPDIETVLKEIRRVLKSGGSLFFTMPFLWPLHDMPHDEYRYTPVSLKRHLRNAGFDGIRIMSLGGWDASLAQMIGLWLKRRPMSADKRIEFTELLFPFYKELVETEMKNEPLTYDDMLKKNVMITGLYGIAEKTNLKDIQVSSEFEIELKKSMTQDKIVIVQGGFPLISATFILDQIIGLLNRGFCIENWSMYNPHQKSMHHEVEKYDLLRKTKYIQIPNKTAKTDIDTWINEFLRLNGIESLESISAFHVHYGANFNLIEPLFRKYQGFVLVSFHGYDASRYFKQHGDSCYTYLFKRANLITTPSYIMKNELVKRGCQPEKVIVHRYGVDISKFACDRKIKSKDAKVVLLTAGRFVEKKGIEYSIKAFARLRNQVNAEYRIIGDGDLRPVFESLIKELDLEGQVKLLGWRTKDEVSTEMKNADIFVLTSVVAADGDSEGIPVSLIEAQACGLPVISTFHAGIPELVENGATGFLVEERNVEAIAEKMALLIEKKQFRDSFSEKAVIRVRNEFNIEKLNDKLADYFKVVKSEDNERKKYNVLLEALTRVGWSHKYELYRESFDSIDICKNISEPVISIIVISWRLHPDTINNFQILELQRNHNYELIFVNNGGRENEFDELKPYIDTYVKLNKNTGAYLARNIGAVFAKAPILFFLEDDGIPERNIVEAHLQTHKTYDVIAVRGVYRPKTNNPLNLLARHYYLGDKPFPHYGDLEGNISYKSSLFYEAGGWDDEIRFGHGGVDLSIRLTHVEPDPRKQIYSPDPIIYHDYAENEDHLRNKKEKQHESRERLCKKHPEFDAFLNRWGIYFQRKDALILRRPSSTEPGGTDGKAQDQKSVQELQYWKHRKADEGILNNRHYEYFYTAQFGLQKSFYDGKKILDIGCGPRGSLEWADNAMERVGLDPLVEEYRELGIDDHKMKYIASNSENIPYPEGYFDVVCAFNSLDHVQDLDKTIAEIQRVLAPGGLFLLITDVNHPPTVCEPISYGWEVIEKFPSDFHLIENRHYEKGPGGIYRSLRANEPYDHTNRTKRYGVLTAKFVKQPADRVTVGDPVSVPSKNKTTCPLISIVVPTFNRSEYLKDALNSALSQTYSNFEVVVVDDGSTDQTAEVVRGFGSDKIRYIRKEHSGAPATRNLGITEAKGEFIVWLDSDDVLLPGTLYAYVDAIKKAADVDVLYGDLIVTDASFNERQMLAYKDWYGKTKELISSLISENPIPNPGVMIRKNCYDRFGNYDESFKRAHDYEFWSRIAGSATFKHIGTVVTKWRLHDSNWAGGKVKVDFSYEARVVKKVLEKYSLHEIYPDINWEESNKAEASAFSRVAMQFMKWSDVDTAIQYLQKSHELFPTEQKEKRLNDLKLKRNAGMPVLKGDPSGDKDNIHEKNKKLTVTYLITSILGVTGGNQTLLNQANALIDRGHRVNIVTYTERPDYFTIKAGVIKVPRNEPMSRHIPKSDAVISTYFTNTVELTRIDAPVRIYYAQGDQFIFEDETIRLSPEKERKKKVVKEFSKASYLYPGIKFVANSHNLAHAVEKAYGRKADAILPVCVDSSIFHPLPKEKMDGRMRILVVGPDTLGNDMEPLIFKGIGDIREALDKLSSKRDDFVVVRMSNSQAFIFKDFQCEFHITPNDEMKTLLYGTADILVYASHYDSCPRPPMEAMASGAAVVCTETSGALEYCRNGENCLLVPIKSPDSLCDAIEMLMDDKMLRETLVRGGFETAGRYPQKREWDELGNLLYSYYYEVVKPRSVVKGLTSIVIALNNDQERTKECIQSIEKFTANPHEVVLVTCNSKTNSVKGIRNLIKGKQNYKFIEGDKNADETRRRNQGIEASSGEYILLLNNDVVVTEGWLSGMLECLKGDPETGIVGPMTNNISGIQKVVNADYRTMKEMHEYAQSFRGKNRYRRIPSWRIAGFFMLFRRELVEKIGILDETFGTGNSEDEDFCLRAALEGYRNFIAGDVFIHHYESRSSEGDRIHYQSAMTGNRKIFKEKWSGIEGKSSLGGKVLALGELDDADTWNQKGKLDMAAGMLLKGIRHVPTEKRLYYALSEMLIDAKQFKDAYEILKEMSFDESDLRRLELMGYCKEGMECLDEADGYAGRALSLNPSSAPALNLKGILAHKKGDNEKAQELFQKAIEADPGFGEPYTNIGVLKWASGQREEALNLLEKGCILSPTVGDIATSYHLAISALACFERAERVFREAQALYPHNRRIAFLLIDTLIQQGKNDIAMREIEKAMVTFGIDDGMLSAALKIRETLGPRKIDGQCSRSTLSLCMIVKNEEACIAQCLMSVSPVIDEIIIVDTGSTDRTKEIAQVFGAQVYDFQWTHNFAEARNFSLAKAHGDWILVLDADEVISSRDHAALTELVKKQKPVGYSFNTRNYTRNVNIVDWVANDGKYHTEEAADGWFPSQKVRLFPCDPRIRFENHVHEFVESSLQRAGIGIQKCEIPVHHYGRLNQERDAAKEDAYYELGKVKLQEKGDDLQALSELAVTAGTIGKYEEAIGLWQRIIALKPDSVTAFVNLGHVYLRLRRYEDALAVTKRAVELASDKKEAVLNYATSEVHAGDVKKAISVLEDLLKEIPEYPPAIGVLAAACCIEGEKEKGLAYIEKLKKLGFNCPEFLYKHARSLISAGRTHYAIRLLEAAVESKHVNDDITLLLSELQSGKGCEKPV